MGLSGLERTHLSGEEARVHPNVPQMGVEIWEVNLQELVVEVDAPREPRDVVVTIEAP